jgi:hypothetical protein
MSGPRVAIAEHCAAVNIGRSRGYISFAGETLRIRGENPKHVYAFEHSERFGPARCRMKSGDIAKDPFFSERSPFWALFERWTRGGKLVDADGWCVLPPTPPTVPCPACDARGWYRLEGDRRKHVCPLCHSEGVVPEGTSPRIVLAKRVSSLAVDGAEKRGET